MATARKFCHRLVPHLHTMNHRAAGEGEPLVRPMYHPHPGDAAAYGVPNQFAFGTEMLVAPITAPHDPVTLMGSVSASLPTGTWTDLFTGRLRGQRNADPAPRWQLHSRPARARAIVPLAGEANVDATQNPDHLEVVVAPGADGAFTLVEDEDTGGLSPTASAAITWGQATGTLTIGAATGAAGIVPKTRTWTVRLVGCPNAPGVTVDGHVQATGVHDGWTADHVGRPPHRPSGASGVWRRSHHTDGGRPGKNICVRARLQL